jgi:putative ABC transport system ATP-binding protein
MIEIKNVKKIYKTGEGDFSAVDDISLNIKDGEFVAIVGKSGSGKSTLLNLIGTLDTITHGAIWVDGTEINNLKGKDLASFRNGKIGFVFQNFYLEPEYTVYENIEIPLIIAGHTGKDNKEKIENVLKTLDLFNKAKCKAKTLSGGECQRVAIARAIINNPSIILADEPCGNLDSKNSRNIMEIFKNLHLSGKTILMVTHDEEDAKCAQRIITLADGKLISDETNTVSC